MAMDEKGISTLSLEMAASSATICIILADARKADQPIVFVNRAFTDLTGYSAEESIRCNCRFLQGPLTDPEVVHRIRHALEAGVSIQCEILNYRKSGETFWNNLTIDPIRDTTGKITHFIGFQYDASSERAAIAARIDAEEKIANIFQELPGYVFRRAMRTDQTVHYPFLSRSLFRILGMPDDTDWSGNEFIAHVHADDREAFRKAAISSAHTLTPLSAEFRIVPPSGRDYWFRSVSTPRVTTGGEVVWEGLALDVTVEKASEARLTYLAQHDVLTGLANRLLFRAAVVEAISKTLSASSDLALFYIDLDDFQVLNEELGPRAGDAVLQGMARELIAFVSLHGGTVARLGGDEFGVLLPFVGHGASLEALSGAMRLSLIRPIKIGDQDITTEVCVGAVRCTEFDDPVFCSADERATELMKRADLALRRAKQDGSGVCRVYAPTIDDRVQNRIALRHSLSHGLANEQFQLHYQPIVDLVTGQIVGAEALVRWNHPDLGLQRPDLFIPYAEKSGLIVPLGAWVIRKAMQQAQIWRRAGLAPPRIAINLSGVQLQRPGFLAMVGQALGETGASGVDFEFELTEGTLIGAAGEIRKQLSSLRKLGFGLAIDDFGTGHSTLTYLRDLPVNKIKIDQTFVRQLVIDSNDASIIRAIVALALSLKLEIVAEGIETIMQRDFLLEEGCKIGQGYLLSLPLTAENFAAVLEGRHRLLPATTNSIKARPG